MILLHIMADSQLKPAIPKAHNGEMALVRNKDLPDLQAQRALNAAMLVLAIVIAVAARAGWLGAANQRLWIPVLACLLLIVTIRIVLTERGIRAPRLKYYRPSDKSGHS